MPKTTKKNKKPIQKNKTKVKQKQRQKQSQNINITIDQSKRTNPRQPTTSKPVPTYAGPSIQYVSAPLQQPQQPQPIAQPVPQPSNPLFGSDYIEFKNSLNSKFHAIDSNISSFRDNVNDFIEKVKNKDRERSTNNINDALSSIAQTPEERGNQTNPISFNTSYTSPDFVFYPTESLYTPSTTRSPYTPEPTPSDENAIIRVATQPKKTKERKTDVSEIFKPKQLFSDNPPLYIPSNIARSFFDTTPDPQNKILLALEDKKPEPEPNKIISAIEEVKEGVKNKGFWDDIEPEEEDFEPEQAKKEEIVEPAVEQFESISELLPAKKETYIEDYKNKKIICPYCGHKYTKFHNLNRHLINHHISNDDKFHKDGHKISSTRIVDTYPKKEIAKAERFFSDLRNSIGEEKQQQKNQKINKKVDKMSKILDRTYTDYEVNKKLDLADAVYDSKGDAAKRLMKNAFDKIRGFKTNDTDYYLRNKLYLDY